MILRRRTITEKVEEGSGFIMEIEVSSNGDSFTLPTKAGRTYNYTVYWGDGTDNSYSTDTSPSHTYSVSGTYNVEIKGRFDCLYFNNGGDKLMLRKVLDWGGDAFDGFTDMDNAFYGCTNLSYLAEGGIKERSGSPVTIFIYTFRDCSGLTSLPADLFRYNTSATSFANTFRSCSGLTSLPADLFRYNIAVTSSNSVFDSCSGLTSLPADLFRYNTAMTHMGYAFRGCSGLTSLPADLFRYNTAMTDFNSVVKGCSGLTSLPADLFRYNTAVTSFRSVFDSCSGLTSLPADLFRYNTAVTDFSSTFYNCSGLTLRNDIFGTEYSTRFSSMSIAVNFRYCFQLSSFTGTTGTAPALWNFTYGAGATKTDAFEGHSISTVSNYNDIPIDWR